MSIEMESESSRRWDQPRDKPGVYPVFWLDMRPLPKLSVQVKRYDHAQEWISRAILQDAKPVYFLGLGILFLSQEGHNEALEVFDKALELGSDDASLWLCHGQTLVKLQRPADALISFQNALRLSPRHWEAANQCGILLHQLGRNEESLSYINICNQLRPNQLPTLQQRAALLLGLKRFEDALAICRDAYEPDSDNANICNNVGIALTFLKEDEESLQWFDRPCGFNQTSEVHFTTRPSR